jgi:hypothetical protein
MISYLVASSGALGSLGAFFLFVPVLSLVCILLSTCLLPRIHKDGKPWK